MHARSTLSRYRTWFVALLTVWSLGACASSGSGDADAGGNNNGDAGTTMCTSEGATQCAASTFQTCQGGEWVDSQSCTPPTVCDSTLGCVSCFPGTNYCVDNDVHACTDQGQQGGLVESCSGGTQCVGGMCKDPCAEAEANRSYLGCEYYAVDLDNAVEVIAPYDAFTCTLLYNGKQYTDIPVCYDGSATAGQCDENDTCPSGYTCQLTPICALDAQRSPFAVVVSNPQSYPVDVTITNQAGHVQTVSVAAGQVHKLYPQMMGFADQSLNRSGIQPKAYRVTSTAPIVAYQFNPLDNVDVFSNDGSLLIPRATYDTKYYAMTWAGLVRRPTTNDYNGSVAVVAWEDGTEVRITPTADVRPEGSFTGITAGTATTFTLNAFDVLNLEGVSGGDLSGTLIESVDGVKTVGVFGSHEAVVLANSAGDCCADHIEEQMFPTSTWGTEFAIARSQSRGKGEPDQLRIMAQADGTQVSFTPAPASGSCGTLAAGQFCDVKISVDTVVSANADHPIMIGHYLLSVIDQVGGGTGDPAMSIAVPIEQYRSTYTFLVPSEYAEQYVSVVAAAGTVVTLDGTDVTGQLQGFAGGTYLAGRLPVQAGQHKIDCPGNGCGIVVYGYDEAVSYMFAGGLDLKQIVVD
jgi:hypothetical protein